MKVNSLQCCVPKQFCNVIMCDHVTVNEIVIVPHLGGPIIGHCGTYAMQSHEGRAQAQTEHAHSYGMKSPIQWNGPSKKLTTSSKSHGYSKDAICWLRYRQMNTAPPSNNSKGVSLIVVIRCLVARVQYSHWPCQPANWWWCCWAGWRAHDRWTNEATALHAVDVISSTAGPEPIA